MTDDRLYQLIVKRHYELRSIDDKGKIDIDQMNRMVWMNTKHTLTRGMYLSDDIKTSQSNALKVDKK